MPSLNIFFALLCLAVLVSMLGLSLGALALLLPQLMPRKLEVAQEYLQPAALRLGLLHSAGLLLLLSLADRRPLLGLLGVIWLLLSLFCLLLGLGAWVRVLAFRLFPELGPTRRCLGTGLLIGWACAFPYVGQLLGIGLLISAYAAGLAGWMQRGAVAAPPPDDAPGPPL